MRFGKKFLPFSTILSFIFLFFIFFQTNPPQNQAVSPALAQGDQACTQYEFVTKWGSHGSDDGQFWLPYGVAVDSSNNVYVADDQNHRIQKFSANGAFLAKWGSCCFGDGRFYSPAGVAVDSSNNVYVADTYNDRIQKFSANGTFLSKWGTAGTGDGQFQFPYDVAVDSSNNVYVADDKNHRIQKFSTSGAFLTKWGTQGSGDGQFKFPAGVAVDSSNNVYVVDDQNHRIQKFSANGTFLSKWGTGGSGDGQFDSPFGVAVDSSNNVYVADTHNHRIQKFSANGVFLAKWGTRGTGDGQFDSPASVAVDSSNNVYVADTENDRIQKFRCVTCQITESACGTTTATSINISNITYSNPQGTMIIFRDVTTSIYDGVFKSSHSDSGLSCNTQYSYDVACHVGGSYSGHASRLFCTTAACPTPTSTPVLPTPTVPTPTPSFSPTPTPTPGGPTPTLAPTSAPTATPTSGGPTPTPLLCPNGNVGNLDCDTSGSVGLNDLNILLDFWMPNGLVPTPPPGQHSADLTGNNKVDEVDLSILLGNWGFPPTPTPGARINFYGNQVSFLKMFGQFTYGETSLDTVVGNKIFHSSGLVVDKTIRPNRVYVADTGNDRILGFDSLGTCNNQVSVKCTNDSDCSGGVCNINTKKSADIIFGQPNDWQASCNGDNNVGLDIPASASSLCLIGHPWATQIGEYWMRTNFDVDSEGNLYVPDVWNNRVLRYNQPFSTDKTGGKGDTVADFVWGQDDFAQNKINRGQGKTIRDNQSIYFSSGSDHVAARGISVDPQGNLWVADTFNFRVLRFPPKSKTADLVLGQANFTAGDTANCFYSRPQDAPLNKTCEPTLAKVNPETGDLYIIDEFGGGFKARILVFKPPFTNGMSAERVIVANQDGPIPNYNYYFRATGLSFNPYKEGEYASGVFWVDDGPRRLVLLDNDGNILKVIGAPDKYHQGCDKGYYGSCGQNILNNFNLCGPGSSVGFDNAQNIYIADEDFHRVTRFSLPYNTWMNGSVSCLPNANGGLFEGNTPNSISGYKFAGGVGAFTFGDQLVVKDGGRYLVWSDYLNKGLGTKADLVVGQSTFETRGGTTIGGRGTHVIDDKNRMWTTSGQGRLMVYQLPLQSGSQPLADSIRLYWVDDQTEVSYDAFEMGVGFDKINKKLWLIDRRNFRLLRISNYDDYQNKLFVDMVLGQTSKSGNQPNQGQSTPSANSFWVVTQIEFDNFGNLYLIENAYECGPNDRITMFTAEDLKNATSLFPNLSAKKVFIASDFTSHGGCSIFNKLTEPFSPVSIAFNSKNNMVIGNDGYYGVAEERHLKQLWFYYDPLKKNPDGTFVQGQKPDAYIKIPMGAPGELSFDDQDNFVIQDHTWSKVWIINLDRDPSWLVPVNQ